MNKLVLLAAVLLALVPRAQAYMVYCNFNGVLDSHPITTDPDFTEYPSGAIPVFVDYVEYRVDVAAGEVLTDFSVGYLGVPPASSYWASFTSGDSLNLNSLPGWIGFPVVGRPEEMDTYTPDQVVSTPPNFPGPSILYTGFVAAAPISYYFGYDVPDGMYYLLDTGWEVGDSNSGLTVQENWVVDVSGGQGPVHTLDPIPEPTTLALALVGAAAVAVRRRMKRG